MLRPYCGTFLSEAWWNRWVMPGTAKPNFLRIDEFDQSRLDLTALRVIDLAEVLYNLQHVPGFDECIAKMRNGDIEGTYAELDLGRMLYLNQVPFRYVVPQKVKRLDYDVEVEYQDGVIACAEAKCSIESTELGANRIKNKLDRCAPAVAFRPAGDRVCQNAAEVDGRERIPQDKHWHCKGFFARHKTRRVGQILCLSEFNRGRLPKAGARLQGDIEPQYQFRIRTKLESLPAMGSSAGMQWDAATLAAGVVFSGWQGAMSNRDEFSRRHKRKVALRANDRCSFRGCRQPTSGPSDESPEAVNRIGKAAHIHAAAPGPGARRYLASMSREQRTHITNAIWLCATHADLIDRDEVTYTADVLQGDETRARGKVR